MSSTDAAYARYVALGDSQTEGLGDGDDTTGLRGFADRLAGDLGRSLRSAGAVGTDPDAA